LIYDYISFAFTNGLSVAGNNGKYGYIDGEGNIVIDFIYDTAYSFSGGSALVKSGGKWTFINKSGEPLLTLDYDMVNPDSKLEDGFVIVNEKEGAKNRYGIIGADGNIIAPLEYSFIEYREDGLFRAVKNRKSMLINKDGEVVLNVDYDDILDFHEGLAAVRKNNKHGFVNLSGEVIIPVIYNYLGHISDGLAVAEIEGAIRKGSRKVTKWGVIDKNGNTVIPFEYDRIKGEFSDGLLGVGKKDENSEIKWGYVNKSGETVIPCIYDDASSFENGLAIVRSGKTRELISKDGTPVISLPESGNFMKLNRLNRNSEDKYHFFAAGQEGNYGILNQKGGVVMPFEYDTISGIYDNLICVENNGKWGILEVKH
jgi:hypothetical protein